MAALQEIKGGKIPPAARHTQRSGVDEQIGPPGLPCQFLCLHGSKPGKKAGFLPYPAGQVLRLLHTAVQNGERSHTLLGQLQGDGPRRSARAHQDGSKARGLQPVPPQREGEALPVGGVADPSPLPAHHCIDRPVELGRGSQSLHQGEKVPLMGHGGVEARHPWRQPPPESGAGPLGGPA